MNSCSSYHKSVEHSNSIINSETRKKKKRKKVSESMQSKLMDCYSFSDVHDTSPWLALADFSLTMFGADEDEGDVVDGRHMLRTHTSGLRLC